MPLGNNSEFHFISATGTEANQFLAGSKKLHANPRQNFSFTPLPVPHLCPFRVALHCSVKLAQEALDVGRK
jgi:hypothetical protein